MTRPDPATELAAIKQDILHLALLAARSDDYRALQRLQRSLVSWIQKQEQAE